MNNSLKKLYEATSDLGLRVEQTDKLVRVEGSKAAQPIYVNRKVGRFDSAKPEYFQVFVHPASYSQKAEQLPGVCQSINRSLGSNIYTHSGFKNFPMSSRPPQKKARGYRCKDWESLHNLVEHLLC